MKKTFAISILIVALFAVPGWAAITAGNWYLQASTSRQTSGGGPSEIPQLGGSFSQNGSIISGLLHVSSSDCFDWGSAIPVSGAVAGNNVTLTSDGANGEVVKITASVSSTLMTGNYSITGGCADGDYGTITAVLLSPATGSWNGSIRDGGANSGASASLSQASPNAGGFSPLSGSVALTSAQCSVSGNLVGQESWVLGNVVQAVVNMTDGGVMSFTGFITDTSTSANQMTVNFSIAGGTCGGQTGSMTFTRP